MADATSGFVLTHVHDSPVGGYHYNRIAARRTKDGNHDHVKAISGVPIGEKEIVSRDRASAVEALAPA